MQNDIPILSLSEYMSQDEFAKNKFSHNLGEAFSNYGFVIIKNSGVSRELINDFFKVADQFFKLDVEIKNRYKKAGVSGQRGYVSFGTEHAKQSDQPDLKEFFQFGQESTDDYQCESYPENVIVDVVPEFYKKGMELYRAFENAGDYLLEAIASYLGLDKDYFKEFTLNGSSILRAIYYPPITKEPGSALRSESHEDINLITLLVGASAGGLQVLDKSGKWLNALPGEDEMVINVGDMLQRLTNNKLKSTTHRVVNPPKEKWGTERFSIPFFLHPVSEMDLSCLPECVSSEHPIAFEPITAGEYLDERLREIGLKG